MMTPQTLLGYARAEPFRPFRIHLASGRTFDVRHPELIKVLRGDVLVFRSAGDTPEIPDVWDSVSLMLAESVSHLGPEGGEIMTTTLHSYSGYVFTIAHRVEDPGFVVRFPDVPGIITSGPTLPEAFANGCEALDCHLEALDKLDRPHPEPRHRLAMEPGD